LEASLILLIVCIICLVAFLELFRRRLSAANAFDANRKSKLRLLIIAFYTASALIFVRNIFRTVQIFSPLDSAIWTMEPLFWAFDAAPLLIATVVMNVFYPGKLLV
jgi:hypothetical protein